MSKPRGQASLDPRLVRIDLPWVEIDDSRSAFFFAFPKRLLNYPQREYAQITSTGSRYVVSQNLQGHQRKLHYAAVPPENLSIVDETFRLRIAVTIMVNRVDARIDPKTLLVKDIPGPICFLRDREARRPKTDDFPARYPFQYPLRLPEVFPKLVPGQTENLPMAVAVAPDFMPVSSDSPHQVGKSFSHPTQDEKSPLDTILVENLKDLLRVPFDARLHRVPPRTGNYLVETGDLKVVFNVDGNGVFHVSYRSSPFSILGISGIILVQIMFYGKGDRP